MKLSQSLSVIAGIQASRPIRDVRTLYKDIEECGTTKVVNSTFVHDDVQLDQDQAACVHRIKLDKELEIKQFNIDLDCDDGEIFVFTGDDQVMGPFCNEHKHRRRRNAFGYSMEDLHGHTINKKELDMVVAKPFSHYYGNEGSQQAGQMTHQVQHGDNYRFASYSNNADMASMANKGIQFNTHGGENQFAAAAQPHYQAYNQGHQSYQYQPSHGHQVHHGHHSGHQSGYQSAGHSSQKSNNGQLRFGFDLVLDLPSGGGGGGDHHHHYEQAPQSAGWGQQLYHGGCSYKHIKAANSAFYAYHAHNGIANTLFNKLTDSMYDFQCYYDRYASQCRAPAPVTVTCTLMDFQNPVKPVLEQVEAIIDAQCSQCRGGAGSICTDWYILFAQILYALGSDPKVTSAVNASQNTGNYGPPAGSFGPSQPAGQNIGQSAGANFGPPAGNFGPPAGNQGQTLCGPDECSTGAHNCDADAACIDTCQGFQCICNNGFFGSGQDCCDYNQCMINNGDCGANAKCVDKCKGHNCECLLGYQMIDGTCQAPSDECDANQCLYNNGDCGSYANCVDKCQGRVCACVDGAVMKNGVCTPACDEDQCTTENNNCGANSVCVNKCEGYTCNCAPGFTLVNGECIDDNCDANQCANGEANCGTHATCTDDCDGFKCTCNEGFFGDGFHCCDVDQCATGTHFCPEKSTCVNNCYGYSCECDQGYSMANGDCIANSKEEQCTETTCGDHSTCTDLDDGFECSCEDNYGLNASGMCSLILDQNQCETGESDCGPNSECGDLDIGFECNCIAGYHMEGSECVKDADADQCKNGEADCGPNSTCYELAVGFECHCSEGYHLEQNSCVKNRDANQCENGEATCGANQVCLDQPVGFECACQEGYRFAGEECELIPDANQCETGEAHCGAYSVCVDTATGYECVCIDGYHMEAESCVPDRDANQCATVSCGDNGFCHDLAIGYECLCIRGYHRENDACVIDRDADQCENGEATCGDNMDCVDLVQGYDCVCKPGFHLESGTCHANRDTDQCASGEAVCGPNSECIDEAVGFTCHCLSGFVMNSANLCTSRRDANQCKNGESDCDFNADCYDLEQGFECKCIDGFTGDGKTCCDSDQCAEDNACPANAACVNECDGFKCVCEDGYEMKYGSCEPICDSNQCATGEAICGVGALCVDQCAGHTCECAPGFTGDGVTCCDVDQCNLGAQCQENAHCVNECHGYRCECNDGFTLNHGICQPIRDANQCATGEAICDVNADCVDLAIGFECKCKSGFIGDGATCCDANQCLMGASCGENAYCVNECIGYSCQCKPGFVDNHGVCEEVRDANQCANGEAICGLNAKCIDLAIGYICECNDGFTGDGQTCCDANQCEAGASCPENSECVNKCLGYECECIDGYQFKHGQCKLIMDANQCANGEALCAPNADCIDKPVGYDCQCKEGFTGNGFSACCDADQCASNTFQCPSNSACTNECMGYSCECNEGFVEKLGACIPTCDEDQCALGTNQCSNLATCTDLCRGYECTCQNGYFGDGYECCDENTCATETCPVNAHCVNQCIGHVCECDEGYTADANGVCQPDCDENQCDTGNHNCDVHAACVDKCKAFECVCEGSWYGDGLNCCDENQCNENNGDCPANSLCVDDCIGFTCKCQEGYEMQNNQCVEICDDIDECTAGSHNCSKYAKCLDTCNGFECECVPGYNLVNDECCDADQCDSDPCGTNTRCIEQCDGYQCVCEDDHVPDESYNGNGILNCRHSDRCHNVQCPTNAVCRNGQCFCLDNFYPNEDGVCVEMINECVLGTHECHEHAFCEDTITGYTCTCREGFNDIDADGRQCIHPYYVSYGMCYLTDYARFTDAKFESVALSSTYCVEDAISAWRSITAELGRLGQTAFNLRSHQCDSMAGYVGCGYISPLWITVDDHDHDHHDDVGPACEWVHELEILIQQVAPKCSEGWSTKFLGHMQTLRKCACNEPDDCFQGNHQCSVDAICTSKEAVYGRPYSGYTCNCKPGFYGNGITCIEEVNECTLGTHRCDVNAICTDFPAGYECACREGFVGNGYKCKELVNECATGDHDCHRNAICTDLENGFMCECDDKNGFTGDGRVCEGPDNECLLGTHRCHPQHGVCTDTFTSYTCACQDGFIGDGYNCYRPLTCPWTATMNYNTYVGDYGAHAPGLCSLKYSRVCWGSIFPAPASSVVAGSSSFTTAVSNASMFFANTSIKFCNIEAAFTQFSLFMTELYTLGLIYDQAHHPADAHFNDIVPTDERHAMMCAPEAGALPCNLINFHDIQTIDQFHAKLDAIIQHVFAKCSVQVLAKWNAWLSSFNSMIVCPVNECLTGDHMCSPNAQCIDKPVGYECVCLQHYEGDGINCSVMDYCAIAGTCSAYSICTPGFGGLGYRCPCREGYSGPNCLPVDPCTINNGGCHAMALCQSEIVGYNVNHWCKCKPGWYGSGKVCEAINPCQTHNCDPVNGVCSPDAFAASQDDYRCACRPGFIGNGFVCTEYINPCDSVTCGAGATCSVSRDASGIETANCRCSAGYTGDGFNCQQIDPCINAQCHPKATCISSPPYYACQCPPGMIGDGNNHCEYPNPCLINPCHPAAACAPLSNGQYTCTCMNGFIGDGMTCSAPPTPAPTAAPTHAPAPINGGSTFTFGGYTINSFADFSQMSATYPSGANLFVAQSSCGGLCHEQAVCMPMFGYALSNYLVYQCVCMPPFIGDGTTCFQQPQCTTNCPPGTVCWDNKCKCTGEKLLGYWYNWDTKQCTDKRECKKSTTNNCSPNATCLEKTGGFDCECNQGYVGDGVSCVPAGTPEADAHSNMVAAVQSYVTHLEAHEEPAAPQQLSEAPTGVHQFQNSDGTDISLFAQFENNLCSLMGFNWQSVEFLYNTLSTKWVGAKAKKESEAAFKPLVAEFQNLGKSVLTRNGPKCDMAKAGLVECKYLVFPHSDHRCTMVRRIKEVTNQVAKHCNEAWNSKFGLMADTLVKLHPKKGQDSCPEPTW